MRVVVEGVDLPGHRCGPNPEGGWYENIHVALCVRGAGAEGATVVPSGRPWRASQPVRGDAPAARWEFDVVVRHGDAGLDFGGPSVRGARGDRHIGLAWGELLDDGSFRLFRGAKLPLAAVDPKLVDQALGDGQRLVARLGLTDAKGHPRCATVRPADLTWTVEPG